MLVGVSALVTPGTPTAGLPPCNSRTFSSVLAAAISFQAARLNTRILTVLNQPPPRWLRMWLCDGGVAVGEPPTREASIMPGWLRHGVPAAHATVDGSGRNPTAAIA